MFRRWRLKKIRSIFLESCRDLASERDYWKRAGGLQRRILEFISPFPLLGGGKNARSLLAALEWLEAFCNAAPLQEETLRKYHRTVLPDNGSRGGDYRRHDVDVRLSTVVRPPAHRVPALMQQLDQKLGEQQERWDRSDGRPSDEGLLGFSVLVHQRLAFIHPFEDANGRVARLAMNHLQRRYGGAYVILPPVNESPEHFAALEFAHKGNPEPLLKLCERCLHPL